MAALEIDGVPQAPGLYGGPETTGTRKPSFNTGGDTTYRFAGTGVLLVPGGGTMVIFR